MGTCCIISEAEFPVAIKGLKIGKAACPTGVVGEMMKASSGFSTKSISYLINNIVKVGCITDYCRIVP